MTGFEGKTVLITGAAGGIGTVLVGAFAERGARIAALDRNDSVSDLAKSLNADGKQAAAAVADIGSKEEVSAAIANLRSELGSIDVLVNNAGFSGASNLETTDEDIWQNDINGNLNGAFNCTRPVLQDMKNSGRGGAIVTIGSVNGTSALGDPAYSAAKAGLINFTKSLAMEYGRFGIRANVVSPGSVRTPIWDHRIEREPEIFERLLKWYPLGRIAEPQDIANAVIFLASDQAAAISGAVLPVDCGLSAGNIAMAREITQLEF